MKYIKAFILVVLFTIITTACQKSPINGDLDGRWQLMEIVEDGVIQDMAEEQLYYSFYLHVCVLSTYGFDFAEANMIYEDNKLYLDFPYISTDSELAKLKRYGLTYNPITLDVLEVNKKNLVLKYDDTTLIFRRF